MVFFRAFRGSCQLRARDVLKRLYYPAYHRLRNRETLTTAMFHRVLVPEDPRYATALSDWTVTSELFESCLRFFKRHYNVVTLEDVLASVAGGAVLPPRSLLITFDDGYADNEQYALPLLRKYRLPAVLFVFSDAIGSRTRPWAEDLQQAYLRGDVSADDLAALHRLLYGDAAAVSTATDMPRLLTAVYERANEVPVSELPALLAQLPRPLRIERSDNPAQMLTEEQLRRLRANGVSIAAHGKTHTALTRATNLDAELREPRRVLPEMLGLKPGETVRAIAFPYGAYDDRVLNRSWQEGYELVFTLRPEIAALPGGRLATPVLGRLNVHGPTIAGDGGFRFEQMAHAFFRAPRVLP